MFRPHPRIQIHEAENGKVAEGKLLNASDIKKPYDVIILDPPAFCKKKDQVPHAARGYKDINLLAFKKLAPRGLLFSSSCSSFIDPDLFQKIVFGAAKDAGRLVRVLKRTGHAIDHPVNIYHPEGEYLKGLLCQVL